MSTPDELPSDPRVHCPRCGKRFRVPAAELADKPKGAPARCTGCGTSFRVREGPGGDVEVVPPAEPGRTDAAPGGVDRERRRSRRRAARKGARASQPRPRERRPSPTRREGTAAPAMAVAPTFGIGERVGRYEVEELLGRGGMGAVYKVFDPAANRHVAMKVLSAGAPEEDRLRFQREVEVQGNIQHPHIMPIFDSSTIGRSRYFTMELLKSPLSLTELVNLVRSGEAARDPPLRPVATPQGLVRRVILPVCQAIYHANWREGVLHRDLKPDNVLIDRNGLRPFVIDFGVCSLLERKNTRLGHLLQEMPSRGAGGGLRVTGTLLYMPPEQARGDADRRGDVWALGAILHHCVTGAPPLAPASRSSVSADEHAEGLRLLAAQARRAGNRREEAAFQRRLNRLAKGGDRTLEVLQRDVLDARYLSRPPGISPGLEAVIAKAMSAQPEQRYRHALELHDDLLAWLGGRPVRARLERRGPVRGRLYRARLFLGRHRRAAVLLLLALGVGAWAAAEFLSPTVPANGNAASTRWLARAEGALREGRLDEAEDHTRQALGADASTRQAHGLLVRIAALRALAEELDAAVRQEAAVRKAFEGGDVVRGREAIVRLDEILHRRAILDVERIGTPEQGAELERLQSLARGRQRVHLAVPGGAAEVTAVAVEAETGRIGWDGALALGRGEEASLSYGRWLLGAHRGKGWVWWPALVVPAHGAVRIPCPVDPDTVPGGRVYVSGGRVHGPLGPATVAPLQWDAVEVTGARYARFLDTLPAAERRQRVPREAGLLGEPGRPLWSSEGDGFVPPPDAERRPVENVSLYDAQAFARFEGGRLPTAAEWAWAASGPDGRLCPLGPISALVEGGVRIASPALGATGVGTIATDRSPYGIFDMAGNVAEMTSTLATFRGVSGWLVMGGGYATPLGRALVREAEAVPGWAPLPGVGFRLVYATN